MPNLTWLSLFLLQSGVPPSTPHSHLLLSYNPEPSQGHCRLLRIAFTPRKTTTCQGDTSQCNNLSPPWNALVSRMTDTRGRGLILLLRNNTLYEFAQLGRVYTRCHGKCPCPRWKLTGEKKPHLSKISFLLIHLFDTILSHKMQYEIQSFLFFSFGGFFSPPATLSSC